MKIDWETSSPATKDYSDVRELIKSLWAQTPIRTPLPKLVPPEERLRGRSALLTLLVSTTLQYAEKHVPYYREYFSSTSFSAKDFNKLSDLERLKVLTRKDIRTRYADMLNPAVPCDGMRSTGGTTLIGETSSTEAKFRMVIPYCMEEMYFTSLLSGSGRVSLPKDKKDVVLFVHFPQRRVATTTLPFENHILVDAPLVLDFPKYFNRHDYFDHVASLLFSEFAVPGVNTHFTQVTFLPAFLLRLFTEEALRRKIELPTVPIKRILCVGDQVSSSEVDLLEEKWQKPIHLTYGFSESHGIAVGCAVYRDRYHFNFAQYVEVLDPKTYQPVQVGQDGLLAVTTLYPFHMAMPFIRYCVGDIVRLHENVCECGSVGQAVSVVGRVGQCVDLSSVLEEPADRRYLGTNDLVAIFDKIGLFPKAMHYKFRSEAITQSDSSLLVKIWVETGPDTSERRANSIRLRISDEIASIDPSWRAAIEAGRLIIALTLLDVGDTMDYFFLGT